MRPVLAPALVAAGLAAVLGTVTPASAGGETLTAEVAPYLDLLGREGPQVGHTARVVRGVWNGAPTEYTFAWERCAAATSACMPIAGATASTYAPVAADVGSGLRARVTATGTTGLGQAVTAISTAVLGTSEPAPGTAAGTAQPGAAAAVSAPEAVPAGVSPTGTSCRGDLRLDGLPVRVSRPFGGTVPLRGRVTTVSTGAPARGMAIALRDPLGAVVATTHTDSAGRFAVTGATAREGQWNVEIGGCNASVATTLRPVLHVAFATRHVRAPGPVRITGVIHPRVSGKLVDLQYLDPRRGWRLWHQVHTGPGGTFTLARMLARNPAAPRFRLRIRAAVPADHGWPFGPATSAPFTVAVR